jgi:two-component system, OmpR family, response regulator
MEWRYDRIMHVLMCVDYGPLRQALAHAVAGIGFAVEEVDGIAKALVRLQATAWDMVVVGLFAPGADSVQAARSIERTVPDTALLMLRGGADQHVGEDGGVRASVRSVLGAGLLVRLADTLRDATAPRGAPLRFGDLELLPAQCRATVSGIDLRFTPCEYRVLEHLALRKGEVVSSAELLTGLARTESGVTSNVIAQWVSRVRTKIRAGGGGDPIETRRGFGYAFIGTDGV